MCDGGPEVMLRAVASQRRKSAQPPARQGRAGGCADFLLPCKGAKPPLTPKEVSKRVVRMRLFPAAASERDEIPNRSVAKEQHGRDGIAG